MVRPLRGHGGEPLLALPAGRLGAGAGRVLAGQQSRGIEELELGRGLAEDRVRQELAAREAQHVSMPGVAGRDPDVVVAWHPADERQAVGGRAEDPGPAVLDYGRLAEELGG